MNRNIIPFNASPISVYNTGVIPTDKQIDIIKNLEYWVPNDNNNPGGVRVSNSTNMLELKGLEDIDKILYDCAKDYMNNVLELDNEFFITNSWSTICRKGEKHHPHTHPNAMFSFVYYVTDSNANLHFDCTPSITRNMNLHYKIKNFNNYNSPSWHINAKAGEAAFFLGDITHYTEPNESDNDRIIIGGNYFLKGTLGTDRSVSKMTIYDR